MTENASASAATDEPNAATTTILIRSAKAATPAPTTSAPNANASTTSNNTPAGNSNRNPDGSTTWTTPTGRNYTKPAAEYPIDHTLHK